MHSLDSSNNWHAVLVVLQEYRSMYVTSALDQTCQWLPTMAEPGKCAAQQDQAALVANTQVQFDIQKVTYLPAQGHNGLENHDEYYRGARFFHILSVHHRTCLHMSNNLPTNNGLKHNAGLVQLLFDIS